MNFFELYLVKSSLSIMMFYVFYYFLLKNETSFKWNRGFLIFSGVFPMVIPFMSFNLPGEDIESPVTLLLSQVLITPETSYSPGLSDPSLILLKIYLTVSAIMLVKLILKIYQIFLLRRKGKKIILHGYKTVLLEKLRSPFSFYSTIFLPAEEHKASDVEEIIRHEAVHIKEKHSFDILIYELVIICQWFNPFAWLCRKELIAQHEFSADAQMLKNGTDKTNYKNLLLSYSMHLGGSSVTNNFNSLLKRRFEMLSNNNSGISGKVKMLFSLPLVALLIFVFGCKTDGGNSTSGGNIDPSNVSGASKVQEEPYTIVNEMPSYPAGQDELLRFISSNIKYPKAAKDKGVQGKIMIGFIVEKDGSVSNIEVLNGIGAGCDEEAVRVTKMMGKWNPGKQDGKPVRVKLIIPFQFKLQ